MHPENVSVPCKTLFCFCCASSIFPSVPLSQMPECCVPSLCLLAFRNNSACVFRTTTNLTYLAVGLPSCAVPFLRGGLASLPAREDAAEPCPARESAALVLTASSADCPSAWGEPGRACQSQANPAHILNTLCKAREKVFLKAPYCYSRGLHVTPVVFLLSFQDSRKI